MAKSLAASTPIWSLDPLGCIRTDVGNFAAKWQHAAAHLLAVVLSGGP